MNRYLHLAVVFLIVAFGIGTPGASAALTPDPQTCEGYPEQRVFLESQVWWKDETTSEAEGRHLHLGTCFPLHESISGVLHLDVRIMVHNMANHGAIKKLRVQIFNNGSSSVNTTAVDLALNCTTDDCVWWQPIDVDTTRVPYDGRWEFRITANIPETVQGHRMYETTRWHAILNNGKPVKDGTSSKRSPGAGGWYEGASYMNVFCGTDGSGYDFVTKVQSGVVKLTCKFDRKTAFASIDPAFHAEPPHEGTILFNSKSGGIYTLTINTTTLSNGAHKLFLRTEATGTNPPGTGAGVLVLPFTVQN
ncbi:MAG: hypothetical protein ACT4NU_02055 [Chromatiales bacterium]